MKKIQLTKDQIAKIAGIALFSSLFIYLYAVYFWLPTAKRIDADSKKIASIQSDIDRARAQKAKSKNLEATLADLKAQKEAAQKKLPTGRKIPDLLRTLADISKKYKVSIVSISPGASVREEYFTRVSYAISATGDYHSLGRFFTALGLEERILNVENVNITGTPEGETSAAASFTLVAYQYSG